MIFNPVGMAMATITVMLWIMWSDTIRARRPSQILYTMRIALFLIVSGVLAVNMIRYPAMFGGGTRWLTIVAIVIGLIGAGYFAKRLVTRR